MTTIPASVPAPAAAEGPDPPGPQRGPVAARVWWAGLLAVWVPLLVYNLLFFNRYFPLTEGWFSLYGRLIRAGQVPYRDFYLFLPPLYPCQLAAITGVFGDEFIVLRTAGVLVILALAWVTYALFTRWFPPYASAFAAFVALVYYQSGVAHITYDFTQFLTLYALLGLYFLIRHLEAGPRPGAGWWKRHRLLLLAGFFAACAFLIKHSNGAFVVLGTGLATAVGAWRGGWRRMAGELFALGCGMLAPVALVVGWLASCGALGEACDQLLRGAVQSKGNLGDILFAWLGRVFDAEYPGRLKGFALCLLPALAVLAVAGRVFRGRLRQNVHAAPLNLAILLVLLPLTLTAVLAPYLRPETARRLLAVPGGGLFDYGFPLTGIHVIVLSTATLGVLLACGAAGGFTRRPLIPRTQFVAVLFILGLMAGNGTSAGLSEISCFFVVGLLTAWLMARAADLMLLKAAVALLGCSAVAYLAGCKYEHPYWWWFVEQPDVRQGTVACHLPGLRGMRLSPRAAETVREVVEAVRAEVPAGAPIFCFPHIPQFYLLTDRWPTTAGKVHWFDFLPDDRARADAARLRRDPPPALVYMDLPEIVWTTHEELFRQGRPLGQRELRAVLSELTETGDYAHRVERDVGNGCRLHVWIRVPGTK